jgi:hypothetical protein
MVPVLADIRRKFPQLEIVGPTQLYGYAARGREVGPDEERPYIQNVRKQFYGDIPMETPVSSDNFKIYGASTTPTLVLVDAKGMVRMYHPGRMTAAELSERVSKIIP